MIKPDGGRPPQLRGPVTTEGRPYLGVPLGTDDYIETFQGRTTRTQPHAAYAAFTHGMASKWVYLSRILQGISSSLLPIEGTKLISSPNDESPSSTC